MQLFLILLFSICVFCNDYSEKIRRCENACDGIIDFSKGKRSTKQQFNPFKLTSCKRKCHTDINNPLAVGGGKTNVERPIKNCTNSSSNNGRKIKSTSKLNQKECGISPFATNFIHGGKDVDPGELPWMAAIYFDYGGSQPELRCSGTLITDSHVITAAHCFDGVNKLAYVILGDTHLNSDFDNHLGRNHTGCVTVHERFRDAGEGQLINDIAIIKLDEPVTFERGVVMPVCVPTRKMTGARTPYGKKMVAAGWGYTAKGATDKLQYVDQQTINNTECEERFMEKDVNITMREQYVCAGVTEGKTVCEGDSGGPLLRQTGGGKKRFYQLAMTSFGRSCTGALPVIYMRIDTLASWIFHQVDPSKHQAPTYNSTEVNTQSNNITKDDTFTKFAVNPDHTSSTTQASDTSGKPCTCNNCFLLIILSIVIFVTL